MTDDRQERIRRKAHEIWERAGGQHGRHEEHWHHAIAEIDDEDAATGSMREQPEASFSEETPNSGENAQGEADQKRDSFGAIDISGSTEPANGASKGDESEALRLAETTDLSPNQAKDLLKKHRGDRKKVKEEAKNFKAEG